VKQKTHNIYNKILKMDKETLRMQMLSGIITEGEYAAAINQEVENTEKDSLNEHYVAGGIVGIGAVTQIPSRAKTDYEDAFEHFLGQKYEINEEMEEAKEEVATEEEVNEGVFSDSQIQILKGQLKSELNEKLSQYIDGENLETLSNDLTEYVLNGMVEIANAASAR
jgi:hypothetical protein